MDKTERIERRLKLHDVRVLMSVVQAGSMHKAADQLGTSQPAISRSISDLEHALGVRLLERSRRGVEPTDYGRAIIKRGVAVFDELRQGIRDVEFLADPTAGELRIGCSDALAVGPVFAAIDRLTRRYPRFVFKVVTGARAALHRELRDRNVDFVLSTASPLGEDLRIVEKLFEDSLVVAAGLHNPWTRRRRIEFSDLVDEPWTLPPSYAPLGELAMEAFRAAGLEFPRSVVLTESVHLRSRLIETGRFLTIFPSYVFSPVSKYPSLKALPVALSSTSRTIAIVGLRNRTPSPLLELFVKAAREVARPLVKDGR